MAVRGNLIWAYIYARGSKRVSHHNKKRLSGIVNQGGVQFVHDIQTDRFLAQAGA